jgi:hypothetical protein
MASRASLLVKTNTCHSCYMCYMVGITHVSNGLRFRVYLVPWVVRVLRLDYDLTRMTRRRQRCGPSTATNPKIYGEHYTACRGQQHIGSLQKLPHTMCHCAPFGRLTRHVVAYWDGYSIFVTPPSQGLTACVPPILTALTVQCVVVSSSQLSTDHSLLYI